MSIKLFTNIMAYRVSTPGFVHHLRMRSIEPVIDLYKIEDTNAFRQRAAAPPIAGAISSLGFIPPCGEEDNFVEDIAPGVVALAVMSYERLLPGKVVRAEVEARARKIGSAEGRKVYAREKQRIKDEVITSFLPRAFIDTRVTYILVKDDHIYIDTSSAKRSEDILCLLRETLGSLPARPVGVKETPIVNFTHWLTRRDEVDLGEFGLTGDFKASSGTDESDLLTGKGISLNDGIVSEALIEQCRRATQLGMSWESDEGHQVVFTINEMLGMKGIKWDQSMADAVREDVGEDHEDERAQRVVEARATLLLLSDTIGKLWLALTDLLGGEEVPTSVEQNYEESIEDEDELV